MLTAQRLESSKIVCGLSTKLTADQQAKLAEIEQAWGGRGQVDHLDGLTVTHDDWWFNVRPSNTEPLLRLNVEGPDEATMARVRDEVLALIRG